MARQHEPEGPLRARGLRGHRVLLVVWAIVVAVLIALVLDDLESAAAAIRVAAT